MRIARWRTPITKVATVVLILALTGAVLIFVEGRNTVTYDLGLAFLSGALVGGVFVFAEATLVAAADERAARSAFLFTLSTTQQLDASDLTNARLDDLHLPNRSFVAARLTN